MNAGHVVEHLRDADPAWQYGDVGDERDVAHELFARRPWVAPQDLQFSFVIGEAEDGVERGALAGAIRADQAEDAALFDTQIDAVERDRRAVRFAEAAGFYACHEFSAPPV